MTKWMGSKDCNFCKKPVDSTGPEFYDASVRQFRGSWALLCFTCGQRFDLLMGQAYSSSTFEKIGDLHGPKTKS